MKIDNYQIGESLKMMCSVCEGEQDHTVQTATKQGKITSAICSVCETSSKFSKGVKTAVSMGRSKTAAEYDRTRKYKKGQSMLHPNFGLGEVTAVHELQKIDVLFGDRTRRLIHDIR